MNLLTVRLTSLVFTISIAVSLVSTARAQSATNYTDIWWAPAESGWGLSLTHHNDQMFGVLYIFDADGTPTWVTIPGGTFSTDKRTFTGDLYRTIGPPANVQPFNISRVQSTLVGSARLQFSDANSAALEYSINGTRVTKSVSRYQFGGWPSSFPFDATDIWWNKNEGGWGMSITRQGSKAFAAIFLHDTNGQPTWLVGSDATAQSLGFSTVRHSFNWKIYQLRGTPYDQPWRSSDRILSDWGTLIFDIGINSPTIEALLTGGGSSLPNCCWVDKPLERMSFGSPRNYSNRVISATPASDARDVPVNTRLSAEFGRPLRQPVTGTGASASQKGFFLYDDLAQVSGQVQYFSTNGYSGDDVKRTMEFAPSGDLKPNQTYRAVIRGQTSADGTPVEDVEWIFKTGAPASFQASPFIAFSFRNYFAVESPPSSSPVIRALSEPAYNHFVISRMIKSDGPIGSGANIWITSMGGIQEISTGRTYRLAALDRSSMRIRSVMAPFTRSNSDIHVAYDCSPSGRRCIYGATETDGAGNVTGSRLEVISTLTGIVERTISLRGNRDAFVNLLAFSESDSAVYAVYASASSETELEIAGFNVDSGVEIARARIPGYTVSGISVDQTRNRLAVATFPRSFSPKTLALLELTGLRILSKLAVGTFSSPGYGVSRIPSTDRLLTLDDSYKNLLLVEGDSLQVVGRISIPPGAVSGSEFASACVESSGSRAWILMRPPEVHELVITGTTLGYGRKYSFDPGFQGEAVGNPVEQIKCLN